MPKILAKDGRIVVEGGRAALNTCEHDCCVEPPHIPCDTYIRFDYPGGDSCGYSIPPLSLYVCPDRSFCSTGEEVDIGTHIVIYGLCFTATARIAREDIPPGSWIIAWPSLQCTSGCSSDGDTWVRLQPCDCSQDRNAWACAGVIWEGLLDYELPCVIFPCGGGCMKPSNVYTTDRPTEYDCLWEYFSILDVYALCCDCCNIENNEQEPSVPACRSERDRMHSILCNCFEDMDEWLQCLENIKRYCCCDLKTLSGTATGYYDRNWEGIQRIRYDIESCEYQYDTGWTYTLRFRQWDGDGVLEHDDLINGSHTGTYANRCIAPWPPLFTVIPDDGPCGSGRTPVLNELATTCNRLRWHFITRDDSLPITIESNFETILRPGDNRCDDRYCKFFVEDIIRTGGGVGIGGARIAPPRAGDFLRRAGVIE